jgi:hypothetical protein
MSRLARAREALRRELSETEAPAPAVSTPAVPNLKVIK